jgi:hypothetical protein
VATANSTVQLDVDSTDEFCRPLWSVQVTAPGGDFSIAGGQTKSDIRICAEDGREYI